MLPSRHTLDQRTCKTWNDVFLEVLNHVVNLNRDQIAGILRVTKHLDQKKYLIPTAIEICVNDVGNSNGIIRLYYNIFGCDDNRIIYTLNVSSPSGLTISGLSVEIPRYGVRYSDLDNV